eukprot:6396631-Prymnesium_polylepis.1
MCGFTLTDIYLRPVRVSGQLHGAEPARPPNPPSPSSLLPPSLDLVRCDVSVSHPTPIRPPSDVANRNSPVRLCPHFVSSTLLCSSPLDCLDSGL